LLLFFATVLLSDPGKQLPEGTFDNTSLAHSDGIKSLIFMSYMIDFFDHMFIVKQSAKGELLSYCLVTVMNECMSGLKLRQLVNAFNHHYII